jgi:uncharacterized Tic20 family protein
MEMLCHGEAMVELLLIGFLCLLGPLAYFYGTDSRTSDTRAGWPGEPRR